MRLMLVGQLEGYISTAGKIALQRGAKVVHCEDTIEALGALRNGKGADVAMVDVKLKIGEFIKKLEEEREQERQPERRRQGRQSGPGPGPEPGPGGQGCAAFRGGPASTRLGHGLNGNAPGSGAGALCDLGPG